MHALAHAPATPNGGRGATGVDAPRTSESPMRLVPFVLLAVAVAVACSAGDRSAVSETQQAAHVPDLVGTADLIVDAKVLATSWVVYAQELKESFCSLEEGN